MAREKSTTGMTRNRLALVATAVVVSAITALTVSGGGGTYIVLVAQDLAAGEEVALSALEVFEVSNDDVPPEAVTAPSAAEAFDAAEALLGARGARARYSLHEGDPLRASEVSLR